MRAFHYTVADRIASIGKHGIQLAHAGVPDTEKAAVWLSTNPVYDATACKMRTKTLQEMVEIGMNPIRYVVDMPLKTWKEHKEKSGIDPAIAIGLEEAGKAVGSKPEEWYCVYKPIRKWLAIEAYREGEWVMLDEKGIEGLKNFDTSTAPHGMDMSSISKFYDPAYVKELQSKSA